MLDKQFFTNMAVLVVCLVSNNTAGQAPAETSATTATISNLGGLGRDSQSIAYIKASNTGAYEHFGESVALSADGNTLAVGAVFEDSGATGTGGDQSDSSAPNAGAVYLFTHIGNRWIQQAYIKASNTEAGDRFGFSVALSHDGNTLATGAISEDSSSIGIDGDQTDNSMDNAGAAYVFSRNGEIWSQQAYVKASNTGGTEEGDQFGYDVALNADGTTLTVSAITEDSAATGINGNQNDDSAVDVGAVYVYTRNNETWNQQAYLKPRQSPRETLVGSVLFGFAIGLDASGDTLAVSGFNEDTNRGSIYIFSRENNRWLEQARVQASNAEIGDALASAIAVSADGNTIVGGAFDEDSALIGVALSNEGNGDQPTDLAVGAAYVFVRDDNEWLQQAFIKPTNTQGNQHFGWAVALSLDGNTLAGGAHYENGGSQGINGDQQDDSSPDSGAVYVYQRTGTTWAPIAYVKAPNASASDEFGMAVALNDNGTVLAVGAPREASSTSDIKESTGDEAAPESGAVYVY